MTDARTDRRRPDLRRALAVLPRGRRLRPEVWQQRHVGMLWLLWAHVPGMLVFALARGQRLEHAGLEALGIAVLAGAATWTRLDPLLRSCAASLGLVVSSSVLVHIAAGRTEAHFHFFIVLAFLALYQAWSPFLVALGYVIVQHSAVGLLDPDSVYDHAGAVDRPLVWALLHGVAVLCASAASLLAWRLTEHEALHDELTGLGNRAYLLEALGQLVERRVPFGLLFVDLDNFKEANDGFGHEVGDSLLTVVGQRLTGGVRRDGFVARLGGDEFAVVLLGVTDAGAALAAAERLCQRLSEPLRVEGRHLTPEASIGVALWESAPLTAGEVLRNADLAMYAAKEAGGNRAVAFRPAMHEAVRERAELEAELRQALAAGQLVVHFQPIVSVPSGEVVGAEALVRWAHPQRGELPPGTFIPLAEKSGLVVAIGAHVLDRACRQAAAWREAHPDRAPTTVSVNVSSVQLREPGLLETVVGALTRAGIDPASLCLEITESSIIEDFDDVIGVLQELKTVGVGLALDDFGTGYSSLSYLHRLPVDCVKIDRAFVRDLAAGGRSGIAHAITQLARSFELAVTAEGVETEAELAAVSALGVDLVQGHLLGRPQPAEGFPARGCLLPRPRTSTDLRVEQQAGPSSPR